MDGCTAAPVAALRALSRARLVGFTGTRMRTRFLHNIVIKNLSPHKTVRHKPLAAVDRVGVR